VAGCQGDCCVLPILEVLASVAYNCKRDIYSRFLHLYSRELYTSNILLSLLIIYIYAHTSLNNCLFVACLYVLLLLYNYTWFSHALILLLLLYIPYAFTYCLLA
jgi:hypothetical protein